MDQLPNARLALGRVDLAVEIFADDDVRGQLAPVCRNFAVGLLEQHFAGFALDGGGAQVPLDGVERIGNVLGAEHGIDRDPLSGGPVGGGAAAAGPGKSLGGNACAGLGHESAPSKRRIGHPTRNMDMRILLIERTPRLERVVFRGWFRSLTNREKMDKVLPRHTIYCSRRPCDYNIQVRRPILQSFQVPSIKVWLVLARHC